MPDKFDRLENWKKFSKHMEEYIESNVVGKYQKTTRAPDLMHFTSPEIAIWNTLKYGLRIYNGRAKRHDLEKIAHYAEIAWTLKDLEVKSKNMELDELKEKVLDTIEEKWKAKKELEDKKEEDDMIIQEFKDEMINKG